MKLLRDKVNVDAPDADYPFGDMNDDDGTGNGTPANREFITDYVQFFEKMFFESGLTANGLSDNEYTGFQLWDALRVLVPLNTKILTGNWNMDTNATISINHGLSDFKKIRQISCVILPNNEALLIPISADPGSTVSSVDSTVVLLARAPSGAFDSAAFNNAKYYLTIQYIP